MKHFFSFRLDIDGPAPPTPGISSFDSGPDHWKLSCHILSSSSCLGLLEVTIKPLASRGGLCNCHSKPKDGSKNWESWILLPYKRSQFCSRIEGRREKCQQFVDFVPQWRPTRTFVYEKHFDHKSLGFTKKLSCKKYIEKSEDGLVLLESKNGSSTSVSRWLTSSRTKSRWHDPQDSGESEASGRPVQPKRVFI